ncbi:hypothetical protein ACIGO9_30135 [Nocardia asteroides]|uniref:hypothetical protein n=1 Tax=Nocardia asteroides TaxID=1824 RepID=UPI0037CA4429
MTDIRDEDAPMPFPSGSTILPAYPTGGSLATHIRELNAAIASFQTCQNAASQVLDSHPHPGWFVQTNGERVFRQDQWLVGMGEAVRTDPRLNAAQRSQADVALFCARLGVPGVEVAAPSLAQRLSAPLRAVAAKISGAGRSFTPPPEMDLLTPPRGPLIDFDAWAAAFSTGLVDLPPGAGKTSAARREQHHSAGREPRTLATDPAVTAASVARPGTAATAPAPEPGTESAAPGADPTPEAGV